MPGDIFVALYLIESLSELCSGGNSLILHILLPPVHLLSIYLVYYTVDAYFHTVIFLQAVYSRSALTFTRR